MVKKAVVDLSSTVQVFPLLQDSCTFNHTRLSSFPFFLFPSSSRSHVNTLDSFPSNSHMSSSSQAYISGTTLAQFVSAAYACSEGCKHLYNLYGLRQSARELTDGQESTEKSEIVIVTATPMNSKNDPSGLLKLGYLTICQAPVHKLSYSDTQRVKPDAGADFAKPELLFHFTKVAGNDGILRVVYTLYESSGSSFEPLRLVKLNVDNLVDSLQGFTKISNVFARSHSSNAPSNRSNTTAEKPNEERDTDTFGDVEVLAREKAVLVKRIAELTNKLRSQSNSS